MKGSAQKPTEKQNIQSAEHATPTLDLELLGVQWSRIMPLLESWTKTQAPPPVFLLTGPAGMGKKTLAQRLAKWIQCSSSPFADSAPSENLNELGLFDTADLPARTPKDPLFAPCEKCVSCLQHHQGNAIDLISILPEDSTHYKVEQFRDLKTKLGIGAFAHRFRVVLIPGAERMTVAAANSLLKMLEEPPPGWVFILTASERTLLLPTIVSRCQIIRLAALRSDELEQFLLRKQAEPRLARTAALRAQGSVRRALQMLQPELEDLRYRVSQFLRQPKTGLRGVLEWSAANDTQLDCIWDEFEQQVHQQKVLHTALSSSDRLELSPHALEQILKLGEVRRLSQTPVNKKLLLQDWLAQWIAS